MFGIEGQAALKRAKIAIIGLGGVGSIMAEYLSRLGVGHFVLIDPDTVERSNLSRIVGASSKDADSAKLKVQVARENILSANPEAIVDCYAGDFAFESICRHVLDCDYLFLAADSMRARLVFNAVVHQYLIPGVQLGSKIRISAEGNLLDVMSAVRLVRPGEGCLWCNQLIDPTELANEAKSDAERKAQAYGANVPNPSVITLNAIACAHAANDFMMDFLNLRDDLGVNYEHFHFLTNKRMVVQPRLETDCPECSRNGRFGKADSIALPCADG